MIRYKVVTVIYCDTDYCCTHDRVISAETSADELEAARTSNNNMLYRQRRGWSLYRGKNYCPSCSRKLEESLRKRSTTVR